MKSKVLEKILSEDGIEKNDTKLKELLHDIISSEYFDIFKTLMSNVKEDYFIQDRIHGITHNERVVLLSMILGIKEGLSPENLQVVLTAALYHDIGRKIGKGKEHGKLSAQILEENKNELIPELDDFDLDMVKFLCEIHSSPDDEFTRIAEEYDLLESSDLRKMVNVLKDADALDRVRLPRFGKLDVSYLRTDAAKEIVETSKELYREYLNIQQDLQISDTLPIDTSIFEISNSNMIQDEENYYIFRTLNDVNIADLNDTESSTIRTKGQIAKSEGEYVRFSEDRGISLEEVYANVRVAKSGKTTNCISFTSNPNVNLDYNNDSYIMYAIPKTGDNSIYHAGKYMLEEINKKISHQLNQGIGNDEIARIIEEVESTREYGKIRELVGKSFDRLHVRLENKKCKLKNGNIYSMESILARLDKKRFFDETQNLVYGKIIAKLTILELNGSLRNILQTQANNATLLSTLGVAFSSSEFIHYGAIEKDKILPVSKFDMEALAILQQAENIDGINKESLQLLKLKILDSIKNQKDFVTMIPQKIYPDVMMDMEPERIIHILTLDEETKKIIPYYKGSVALEYIQKYSLAKLKTFDLLETIKQNLLGVKDDKILDLLEHIQNTVVIPNEEIISRKNNRGVQISESVNLDMNPNNDTVIFTNKEQQDILNVMNSLSKEELEKIVSGDLSVIADKKILVQNIASKNYLDNPNEYYVDYIIDSINIESIYNVSNVRIEKKKELKQKLTEQLTNVDISKLYHAFLDAGASYKDIPNYIVNLLLENGYGKNDSFENLLNDEELNSIIQGNLKNFNTKITPYKLDRFLEILDNNSKVEGTSITLRDYQQLAIDGIEEIFENRNFAGVVLPTGSGKSFVAMTEMMKFQKQNIVYFAPQEEILNQVQRHILKNIVNKSVLSLEDIDKMLEMSDEDRRVFLSDKVYNQNANIADALKEIKKATTEEEKEIIKSKMLPRKTDKNDDVMDAIHTVLPHLEMYCYQSLNGSKYNELLEKNTDLIVFDELHRTGADTWQPLIKNLINSKPDCKILGITATPVRDDHDHTDMMKYMAENYGGYTKEEIESKAYLAQEMYLIDAMQNKYVVEPKIVSFNFSLIDTEEYKYVKETLANEKKKNPNSNLVKELELINASMDEIIYGDTKNIKRNVSEISKVIQENIPANLRNGRFIVFLEQKEKNSELSSEEYVKNQIELVNQYFYDVNSHIQSGYLLSNRKEKSDNTRAIQDFEQLNDEQLKLLYAINMLNEGVHVEGINGELMLRKIGSGSNILYFQQIGRVIYGIDANNPPAEDEVPIIFDVYNNYLTRDLDRVSNITNPTSDLNNMQMISNWINKHERFPDINSENHDEARKAITLKKIQDKYIKYLDGINNNNLSITERKEIEKILEIAQVIGLFDCVIPDRIVPPGEAEIGRVRAFEVRGETKRFLDLFKEAKKTIKREKTISKPNDTLRIRTTMSVLLILNEYGIELSDENFLKISGKELEDDAKDSLTLLSLINGVFPEKVKERVIKELDMDIDELEDFKVYKEFDYARTGFCNSHAAIRNIFSIYDIKDVRKTGILKKNGEFINGITPNGFVSVKGPRIFNGINIFTGTNYDEEGYNINGYDVEGYNKSGYNAAGIDRKGFYINSDRNIYKFRRDGINSITNSYVDEHGFDINGYYWAPNPEFPNDYTKRINTYKKVNEYNFDRDGKWYKEEENGNLIYMGMQDELGFSAFKDINNRGFKRDYTYKDTGELYDPLGFDIFKIHYETKTPYNPYGFDANRIHKETNSQLNPNNFDINHYFYDQKGNNTYTYYNDEGRDIDGWDVYGVDKDGIKHFTQPVDERNFNQKKINIITKMKIDENELDYYGNRWRKDGHFGWKMIDSKYGKDGYNKDGIDLRGFRKSDKYNVHTNSWADENGWDYSGYYWQKDESGELKNTGSKFAPDGFNREGYNRYGFNRNRKAIIKNVNRNGKVELIESDFNKYGFNYELIHKNGTPYDDYNFDADGINKFTGTTVNEEHFNIDHKYCKLNINGKWVSTDKDWNDKGFDINAQYHKLLPDGTRDKTPSGEYDEEGYNMYGVDKNGFDREHLYVYDDKRREIVNPRSFGYDGYYYEYNSITNEYIKTDRREDPEGYNMQGLNQDGFDRNHLYLHKKTYNEYGFDWKHLYKGISQYDERNFDFYGINKQTKEKYNSHFFDRDGFFYEKDEKTGNYEKTERKVNSENFDIDGFYYEKSWGGRLEKTGYRTNPFGIDIDGNYDEDLVRDSETLKRIQQEKKEAEKRKIQEKKELEIKEREERKRNLEERKRFQEELKKSQKEKAKQQAKNLLIERKRRKQEKEEWLQDFKSKFDDNGICKSTGLTYDENYFNSQGINIITGTEKDVRGFECFGRICTKNNLGEESYAKYDKKGFKQDGTYRETGEKYHDGYNAYGVNRLGQKSGGAIPDEIRISKEYLEAIFNPNEKMDSKKYVSRFMRYYNMPTEAAAIKSLKIKLFIASEMYPPMKKEIQEKVKFQKEKLTEKMNELRALQNSKNRNNEAIGNLLMEIKKLRDMNNMINF